jgi:hypothetical protein
MVFSRLNGFGDDMQESPAEIAGILRAMIRHEDEQANRRVTWLATFQGLLLAALGFASNKSDHLTSIFAMLGISVALLVYCGMVAGRCAINRIRKEWGRLISAEYDGPMLMGFYPDSRRFSAFAV